MNWRYCKSHKKMKAALDAQPTTSFAETAPSHLVNFKKSYLVKPLSSTFGRSKLFHHFKNICGKRKISWMFYSVDQSMPGIWRVKTKFCGLDETWCNSFWFNKVVLNCYISKKKIEEILMWKENILFLLRL